MNRLVLLAALSIATSAFAAERPNILLIYSDDHGWADLGAQDADRDIRTPHLDQLARDGVRFTRGYVSAPQCVPSRAGLITGRYQQRFGVEDNTKGPLPLAELTIAERLKPAGYVTGHVGKWHLDIGGERGGGKVNRVQREFMPHAQGFDEYWRGELRQFFASHDLTGKPFADAPHLVNDDRFRVVVQTDAALSFLDRRAAKPEQPWFLYLAWYAPHVPLESPEPWFSKTPAHLPKERRQALAMIAAMDDGLGQIRTKLRAMGAENDTLIVFVGDNGAPTKTGAWNGSVNAPLIGEKGMLTDGGIRVPFLAAWPGKIPAGQVYEKPVINLDIAATAVALAGQPHEAALDGVNLLPFLTGENKSAPHDALYWRWRSQAAVLESMQPAPRSRFARTPASPVFSATKSGDLETLGQMLNSGASPNPPENAPTTPLHQAVIGNDTRAVELLLSKGANPNLRDIHGDAPLHYALREDATFMAELLLKYGANPNLADHRGKTPLMIAESVDDGLVGLVKKFGGN